MTSRAFSTVALVTLLTTAGLSAATLDEIVVLDALLFGGRLTVSSRSAVLNRAKLADTT